MKAIHIGIAFIFFALIFGTSAANESHTSNYASEQQRATKSLSEQDIADLLAGRGWNFAKAAELNGIPGPVHVLEMANEISLTEGQKFKISRLFSSMKQQAIPLGEELVHLEKDLDIYFTSRQSDPHTLKNKLEKIGQVRSKLRYVHLSSHLKIMPILSQHQIQLYNKLRGYEGSGSCAPSSHAHAEADKVQDRDSCL